MDETIIADSPEMKEVPAADMDAALAAAAAAAEDPESLIAAFQKAAPELEIELRLVAAFAHCGGGLLAAEGEDRAEDVIARMQTEYWIDGDAARMICGRFLAAAGKGGAADNSLLAQADRCYRGDGVPQDKEKAAELYAAAAEEGDVTAQYTLGYMLDKGDGVEKDREAAMVWYEKAAAQGHESAVNRLNVLKQAAARPQPEKKRGLFGRR
ncbi:MAG: tetratricopeptide repeat protein [Bacillota bacterium]